MRRQFACYLLSIDEASIDERRSQSVQYMPYSKRNSSPSPWKNGWSIRDTLSQCELGPARARGVSGLNEREYVSDKQKEPQNAR